MSLRKKIVTTQNDQKSVAFVMYSLITLLICWKAVVNLAFGGKQFHCRCHVTMN